MFSVCIFSSFMTVYLSDHYNIDDHSVGYFILCISFPYLPGALLIPLMFKKIPKKFLFVINFLIASFGYLLMGPSEMLKLPDNLILIIIGMVIIGFFSPIGFIYPLADAISEIQSRYKIIDGANPELDGFLSDTLSGI